MVRRIHAVLLLSCAAFSGLLVTSLAGAEDQTKNLVRSTSGSGNLYEKLIVASDKAYYQKKIGEGDKIHTSAFNIYFRLKTDTPNNEKDGHYRFGTKAGQEKGWIKKDFVKIWNTRFCFDPRLPQPERNFTVYSDAAGKDAAFNYIGEDGRVPRGKKRFAMITGMPQKESDDPLCEVVVFTGLVESGGAKRTEQMSLLNLKLEIVFVIDTTPSMEPLIEVAKEVVQGTARTLANMPKLKKDKAVHFGLVEYRDKPPLMQFASRIACGLTDDMDAFEKAVGKLTCETMNDRNDVAEDMIAGICTAFKDIKWVDNSCKQIIVLGDAPAKDGTPDAADGETLKSSSGWTFPEVFRQARPRGGSSGSQSFAAKTFNAICNTHDDPTKDMPEERRKALLDPEFLDAMGKCTPDELAEILKCSRKEAMAFYHAVASLQNGKKWETRLKTQLQTLAQNQGEIPGYYTALDTYRSPGDKVRAVKELCSHLEKGYDALAQVREGENLDAGQATQSSSVARAIYSIVGTNASSNSSEPVRTGWARTRDANGRAVADQKVMVFKDEMMRLYSSLDQLHTRFKSKSDKAARQNVNDILEDLKAAVATQAAGQEIQAGTKLNQVITFDFPIKTSALNTSPEEIAVMSTPAFNNWLDSLAEARDRAKDLVLKNETAEWTVLNEEEQDSHFAFLKISELP